MKGCADDRVGADLYKSTHALAAVDAGTGQLLGERAIPATERGHFEALRWAHEFGQEIVWAIEDCRDLSHHLEQALLAGGERVVRVAPKLMGARGGLPELRPGRAGSRGYGWTYVPSRYFGR